MNDSQAERREGVLVRSARPEEDAAILNLTLAAYREYENTMSPEAWAGLQRAIHRVFRSDCPARKIVAVCAGAIVGSVLLYPARADAYAGAVPPLPWPEVRLLSVHPEARGLGVGSTLMKECIRLALADGAERLGIHTSTIMFTARDMYRRMGFKRAPEFDFQPIGSELVEAHVLDLVAF